MYIHLLYLYIFEPDLKTNMKNPKTPETKYPISELISKRWSARSFADKAISEETVEHLFEATSWTASSMNEQPWKFLYAYKGSEGFDKMSNCLMQGNKVWAENGAVMILALAKRNFSNGTANRHAMHDIGAANTTLLLEAASLDIYGHMMGGFHFNETLEAFNLDANEWEPACFTVIGYLDNPEKLAEPFRSRETALRTRKPLNEITEKI